MLRRAEDDDGAAFFSCGVLVPVFRLVPLDLVSIVSTCRAWRDVVCGDAHLSGVLRLVRAWRRFPEAVLGVSRQEISANNWPVCPPLRWLLDETSLDRASATLGSFTTQVEAYHARFVEAMERRNAEEENKEDTVAVWRKVASKFRPAIALDFLVREGATGEALPVGSSKWNGLPDVPVEEGEWPLPTVEEDSLSMLLQLRCCDLVPFDCFGVFPEHGLLQFWHGEEDWDSDLPIVHHEQDDPSQLVSIPYPEDSRGPRGREAPVVLRVVMMHPHDLVQQDKEESDDESDSEGSDDPCLATYSGLVRDLACSCDLPKHWLFGNASHYPCPEDLSPKEVLLCQLRTDKDGAGFDFEGGSVYWWICKSDLAAGNWSEGRFYG